MFLELLDLLKKCMVFGCVYSGLNAKKKFVQHVWLCWILLNVVCSLKVRLMEGCFI